MGLTLRDAVASGMPFKRPTGGVNEPNFNTLSLSRDDILAGDWMTIEKSVSAKKTQVVQSLRLLGIDEAKIEAHCKDLGL